MAKADDALVMNVKVNVLGVGAPHVVVQPLDDAPLPDALRVTPAVVRKLAEPLVRAALVATDSAVGALFERGASGEPPRLLWGERVDDAVLRAVAAKDRALEGGVLAPCCGGIVAASRSGRWVLFLRGDGAYGSSAFVAVAAVHSLLDGASTVEAEQEATGPTALPAADAARRFELLRVLELNEWQVSRVSRALGVTRMTVYARMRRLHIPRKRVRLTRGRVAGSVVSQEPASVAASSDVTANVGVGAGTQLGSAFGSLGAAVGGAVGAPECSSQEVRG